MTQTPQWKVPAADAVLRIGQCPRFPWKKQFSKKRFAEAAVDRMRQVGNGCPELEAFKCKSGCGRWHVGKNRDKRIKRLRKRGLL